MRLAHCLALSCVLALPLALRAQYTAYVLKAGPSVGTQRWDDFEQDPLFGFHAVAQIEAVAESTPRTVYAALGYHRRGSAIRTGRRTYVDRVTGEEVRVANQTIPFRFDNLGLSLGVKQAYPLGEQTSVHFAVALRGERNLGVDLGGNDDNSNYGFGLAYPVPEFVSDWLYGVDFGGGIDFELSPALDGIIELRVSPDLSRQYYQPPIANVVDPVTGNARNLRERSIRNVSLELSFGLRFIRFAE